MANPFGIEGPFEQEKKRRGYMRVAVSVYVIMLIVATLTMAKWIITGVI